MAPVNSGEKRITARSTDRRAVRTRRMLRESLFKLILERGYNDVTVEEITQEADMGRTTFYLHYRDKEDLLLQCIEEIATDLAKQIHIIQQEDLSRPEGEKSTDLSYQSILFLFRHAAENASIYRIILRGEGAYKTSSRIREITSHYAAQFITRILEKREANLQLTIPLEVVANYFAGSLLGMLTWWLESGLNYQPEETSEMFRQMLMLGLSKVIQPV